MAPGLKAAPGQLLEDRFLLLEEIGRGGMATVFKARDLENADTLVAVKVPLPMYASGMGSWSMFQREAEIGLALDHACMLRFVPLREDKRRSYFVTEYVAGVTLESRIGKGRWLPEAEALRIVSKLCEAVDYLHQRGFVHYDIKPGNVILGDDGSIRLIDLGMAHPIVKGRFGFVRSAPPIASSNYVAPEQIGRAPGQTSVDIYALGATLYEMLTGFAPFENDDPFVVASARQIGDPKAPRALNPSISREAEEIVLRALRRDPKERYGGAAEFRAAAERPAEVRVSGLSEHLVEVTPWRRGLRRIRYVAIVGVAPVAFLVLSFRLLWWFFERRP